VARSPRTDPSAPLLALAAQLERAEGRCVKSLLLAPEAALQPQLAGFVQVGER
jgi:hypothetical protein